MKKISARASIANTPSLLDKIYYYWKPIDTRQTGAINLILKPYINICRRANIKNLIQLKECIYLKKNFKYMNQRCPPKKNINRIYGRYDMRLWMFPTLFMCERIFDLDNKIYKKIYNDYSQYCFWGEDGSRHTVSLTYYPKDQI